jgi:hypothetical protein
MDGLAIIVMLLALMGLIGVLVYVLRDYYVHKESNASDFSKATSDIASERTDRLGNLKYIVDQVNTVNDDIYATLAKSAADSSSNVTTLTGSQGRLVSGLDSFVRFTSNESVFVGADGVTTLGGQQVPGAFGAGAPSPSFSIMNLPGTSGASPQLIQHTSFMSGMTARDLRAGSAATAKFCAPGPTGFGSRCIQFPNSDGDTYLTTLENGKSIVLDGPVKVTNELTFGVPGPVGGGGASMFSSRDNSFGLNVMSTKTSIGPDLFAAGAVLEVRGSQYAGDVPLLRVSTATNASEAILVSANGDVSVSSLSLRVPGSATTSATLTADPAGGLKITGDLSVIGKLTVSGGIAGTLAASTTTTTTTTPP